MNIPIGLVTALKELASILTDIEIGHCSDVAAEKIHDGLHALAAAIDDLTSEIKLHTKGRDTVLNKKNSITRQHLPITEFVNWALVRQDHLNDGSDRVKSHTAVVHNLIPYFCPFSHPTHP